MSALMTNVMRTGSLDAAGEETVRALYRAIFLTERVPFPQSPIGPSQAQSSLLARHPFVYATQCRTPIRESGSDGCTCWS